MSHLPRSCRLYEPPPRCLITAGARREALKFDLDVDELALTPLVPLPMLAFAVVRLGESFLYADVLASRAVDLDTATTVLDAFVTSVLVPPDAAGG